MTYENLFIFVFLESHSGWPYRTMWLFLRAQWKLWNQFSPCPTFTRTTLNPYPPRWRGFKPQHHRHKRTSYPMGVPVLALKAWSATSRTQSTMHRRCSLSWPRTSSCTWLWCSSLTWWWSCTSSPRRRTHCSRNRLLTRGCPPRTAA